MIENMLTYFSLFCSFTGYLLMYKILSKSKEKIKKNVVISISIFTLISSIISINGLVLLNLFLNLTLMCFVIKIYSKKKLRECTYYGIIIYIIALFFDAMVSMLITNYNLLNFEKFLLNQVFRSLLVFPVFISAILFCLLPPINYFFRIVFDKFIDKVKMKKQTILALIAISLLIIILFCLNAYNRVDKSSHLMIIILIISFIILFITIIYLMYREFHLNLLNKRIIEENNYIKAIAKQDEEFKHNLINNLLGIKTVSSKKTNKLIDELISDYKQDYKNITNINELPNGVQSIIYRKAYEENIEELNLVVDNSIEKELYDILSPKKYNHLCTSIGILFDNALEAVKNNKEKVIEINFLEDKENIYFILKNSFSNFIDLDNLGKRSFTTKLTGHGIGVNYIANLKTLEMKNEIINNMFVSKLIIKKLKKI